MLGQNAHAKDFSIEIEHLAAGNQPLFKILAHITVNADSVCLVSVRNQFPGSYGPPPGEWRGFHFFAIIPDEAKRIASEHNISMIETVPNDKRLRGLCTSYGFVAGPEDMFDRMVYWLAEGSVTA